MTVLTEKKRDRLKKKTFGLPKERKYPMPDRAHAINAKARATQMLKKGEITEAEAEKIKRKANRVINKAKGAKK